MAEGDYSTIDEFSMDADICGDRFDLDKETVTTKTRTTVSKADDVIKGVVRYRSIKESGSAREEGVQGKNKDTKHTESSTDLKNQTQMKTKPQKNVALYSPKKQIVKQEGSPMGEKHPCSLKPREQTRKIHSNKSRTKSKSIGYGSAEGHTGLCRKLLVLHCITLHRELKQVRPFACNLACIIQIVLIFFIYLYILTRFVCVTIKARSLIEQMKSIGSESDEIRDGKRQKVYWC